MYSYKDNVYRVSVRNLIEFVLRSGDLDNRSTGDVLQTDAMLEGSRLHRKIQKSMPSDYKAEVGLDVTFEYEDYTLVIEGRADGIIDNGNTVVIDEIKTMYCSMEHILEPEPLHVAQAMCYAYMYLKRHDMAKIGIQMTYCDIDTEDIKRFNYEYEATYVEQWFEDLVEKYNKWIAFVQKERGIRDESILKLSFPFEYREGQKELAVSVYRTINRGKRLFIEAPTGVGKTISTLYPSIKSVGEHLSDKIFYLTAKTITRTVAFETFSMLKKRGLHFRTMIITAKDKACILDKPDCNPDMCERAKGHFDRINDAIFDLISHELLIDRDTVFKYALKHNVCPFEMSLDVSYWCDCIICDYNYVFDPNVALKRYFSENSGGDYIFLVDEAHNLIDRGREMYSAVLYKDDFLAAKKAQNKRSRRLDKAINRCNRELLEIKKETEKCTVITLPSSLMNAFGKCYDELVKFLEENKKFDERDRILQLFFDLRHFLHMCESHEEDYITYADFDGENKFFIKHFLVNTSGCLKERMDKGRSTILFSATLLPMTYYKDMLGEKEDYAIYAKSVFDNSRRALLISKDVSSKYTRRNQAEFNKIARYIDSVVSAKVGNYMVFFPSYRYMYDVCEIFNAMFEQKYECVMQESGMSEEDKELFLDRFRQNVGRTLIGFSVIGGVFSEGIDLKEEALIGVLIVGTGLPQICSERELLRKKFDDEGYKGYEYSYVFPGMNKVLQAAGRLIRTENDSGVLALMDERFLESSYRKLFPREWDDFKVVNEENVGEASRQFWEKPPCI